MNGPQPGEFDGERASPPVAGFADALVVAACAAVIGRVRQPETTADLATIVERAIEHFVDQFLAARQTNPLEFSQLNDLGIRRTRRCRGRRT